MKSSSLLFVFLIISQITFSQIKYGFKGGLNFDLAGEIKLLSEQLQKEGDLDNKSGFHIGVYAQVDFLIFYLRPELQLTKVSSKFEGNSIDNTRIDLPISFGVTALGPLSLFAGPTAFFSLNNKSNELSFQEVKNKTTLGIHLGTRLKLGPLGIDLRYEKGLSAIESQILSQDGISIGGQIDTQPNQFILGVSFRLN